MIGGGEERGKIDRRRLNDKKVNREEKYLVDRLEKIGLHSFNGCGKGDEMDDHETR